MSMRLKLTVLLILLFVASIGNAIFTFILEGQVENKLAWVLHIHEVMDQSDKLLSTVIEAETGQRGFLLTGDAAYLEPYHHGLATAEETIQSLMTLTEDSPAQHERLSSIHLLIKNKFRELKQTITLVLDDKKHGVEQAIAIVKKDSGKEYMDHIKVHLVEFHNEELVLLEIRKGDFREYRAYITTLIGIEILFFIFLAIVTSLFVNNKLFHPLRLLLASTSRMERGERQKIEDVLPKDEMGYLLAKFYQMSEKVYEKTEWLSYRAHHDELTGLYDRTGLEKEIKGSIIDLNESGGKLAVLFIDLNEFKQFNDTLGHEVGDAILRETAERLENAVRLGDVVFRHGGDEFVILIKNIHDVQHIENVVKKITKQFEYSVICGDQLIEVSLSIGIAIAPDDSVGDDEVLRFSDVAMYAAKNDKTCNYKFFDRSMLRRSGDNTPEDSTA